MITVGEAFDAMGYALKSTETVCVATLIPGGAYMQQSLRNVASQPIGANRYFSTGTFPVDTQFDVKGARDGSNVERILEMPFDFDLQDFLDIDKEVLYDMDADELESYIPPLVDSIEGVFNKIGLPIHRMDYTGYGVSAHINMPVHDKESVPGLRDAHKGIVRKINAMFGGDRQLADRNVVDAGSRIMRLVPCDNIGMYRDGTMAPVRTSRNIYMREGYVNEALLLAAADMIAWQKPTIPTVLGPVPQDEIQNIIDTYKPHHQLGQKHFLSLAIAGQLAKGGVPEDQAIQIIEAIAADDQKPWDRVKAVRDTYDKARSGAEIAGYYALRGMVPDEAIARVDGILSRIRRKAQTVPTIVFRESKGKGKGEKDIVLFDPPPVPDSALYGWHGRHAEIMSPTTMASDSFHLGSSLALQGAAMGRRIAVMYSGDKVHANQYNLLVGRTGSSYKDTAAKRAIRLTDYAQAQQSSTLINPPFQLVTDIASRESMVKMFSVSPNVLMWSSEIVSLFKAANRDKTATLLDGLIHVWDTPPTIENNSLAARRDNGNVAENPTLTIIGGIQPGRLEQEMTETVMTSGMGNRFGFFMGAAKGRAATTADVDEQAAGLNYLELHRKIQDYPDGTVLRLSPEAGRRWHDWFMAQKEETDEIAADMKVRHPVMIHKWALCYAVSDGADQIELKHLEPAIALCEWMWDCVAQCLPSWGSGDEKKIEERVLTVLRKGKVMEKRRVHQAVGGRFPARLFNSVLQSMVSIGVVASSHDGRFLAIDEHAIQSLDQHT